MRPRQGVSIIQSDPELVRSVHDALAHYYDHVYLERHPLGGRDSGLNSPDQIRAALNAAIESLRPPEGVSESSRLWRPYRLIQLRYLEARDPIDVQRQLGLSKSPYYQEHERALGAITSFVMHEPPNDHTGSTLAQVLTDPGWRGWSAIAVAVGARTIVRAAAAVRRVATLPIPTGLSLATAVLMLAAGLFLGKSAGTSGGSQVQPGARASQAQPRPSLAGASTPRSPAGAAGKLIYQDDFSDASERMFVQERSGYFGMTNVGSDGVRRSVPWHVIRQDGAFVATLGLIDPPSENPAVPGFFAGNFSGAEHRFSGDVAFEVTGKAVQNAEQAAYGLVFNPGVRRFAYAVLPGDQHYYLFDILSGSGSLRAGHASGVRMGDDVNRLRIEARGIEIRMILNDEEIDRARDEAFGGRPAVVGMYFARRSSSIGDDVQLHFHDFRIYSLDP